MKGNKQMKSIMKLIYPMLALLAFACFALSPSALAICREGCLTNQNTVLGENALFNNTMGANNTANGNSALFINTTGSNNTANGTSALFGNTTGDGNTASGNHALFVNTTGTNNTAIGNTVLFHNLSGGNNTASGGGALFNNVDGSNNSANGFNALLFNTNGNFNTADGVSALTSNTTGNFNTATGLNALSSNTVGGNNTAVGVNALVSSTGSNNVGLGFSAGHSLTGGSGNVCIGAGVSGVAGESNTTRIKNVFKSVANGRAVYVNSDNKIGTLSSSRRYKEEIKPMDRASESLFSLKPVTFRYKKEVDPERALSFGLIAEDVAQISPELITRDEKGNPQTVCYEAVNAMLLNEFLKEHKTVQQQGQTIARLEKQLETLTSTLQRVSAQLELNKPAPQTVLNNQ